MPISQVVTMKIIDLSIYLDNDTPTYPGDDVPEILQSTTIANHGWNSKKLLISSHIATHIDAPFHMFDDGKKLDEFPLETFAGSGVVLDVNAPKLNLVKKNDILLFSTGLAHDDYPSESLVSADLGKKIVALKPKIVGFDSFSPDVSPFEIHHLFFKNNILIAENLTNLKKLIGKRCEFYILPLKIKNADGAPCRAIAILD